MVLAFAWPAANTAPRDVPLVVTGPQSGAVAAKISQQHPSAFKVTQVADEAAARKELTDRQAYGAIVVTPQGPRVLVASAASPLIAQQLTQIAQPPAGTPPTDVVHASVNDPRGSGFGAMVLPLIMSGISAALTVSLLLPALRDRLIGLAAFAIGGGLVGIALAQGPLDILPGSYLALAGVAALGAFAVSATITGLTALLGRPGFALGSLTFLLLGNPLSGATSAPELLPQPWGTLGQLLPPGATATLLRSVAFFDGARVAHALTVLLVWTALGLAFFALAALRTHRTAAEPAVARQTQLA
jgi:hypothetical protein